MDTLDYNLKTFELFDILPSKGSDIITYYLPRGR